MIKTTGVFGQILAYVVGGFMLYFPYIWCNVRHEDYSTYGIEYRFDRKAIIETLVISLIILVAITPVAFCLNGTLPHHRTLNEILSFAGTGFAAAVIEETFFRGFIQHILRRKSTVLISIVVTNLLFAVSHLIFLDDVRLLLTFFPGLVMGYLAERNDTIVPSIIFHSLGNLWSIWFFPFV